MNIRQHKEMVVAILQEVLSEPNARTAAQRKLYTVRASLLNKKK